MGLINLYDYVILIFLYAVFSVVITIDIVRCINKDKKIKLFTFVKLFFLIVYGITPILSITFYKYRVDSINYLSSNVWYYYLTFVLSVIFYIIMFFSHSFFEKKIVFSKRMSHNKKYCIDITTKSFYWVSILIMLIGAISLFLWVKVYGYPFGMFKYASAIRSGYITIYNKFTFLKPFCYFSIVSSFSFYVLYFKHKKSMITLLFLLFSVFNSIVLIISNDGRMLLIIYLLVFVLFYLNDKIKQIKLSFILKLLLVAFVTIFLLGKSEKLLYVVKNGKSDITSEQINIFEVIGSEFSFTHINNINILYFKDNDKLNDNTELNDIKNLFLAWVPSRLKPNETNLFDINTNHYYKISGQIPTDIISASIYKFGFLGIVVLPFVVSLIFVLIEQKLNKYSSIFINFMYNLIGVYLGLRFVAYYDLSVILFGSLYIIVTMFLYCTLCKKSCVKECEKL